MALIRRLDRLLGLIELVCRALAGACLVFMLASNLVNIVLRTTMKTSLTFVAPWTTVVFIWMSFIGFYCLYRLGRDIRVDLIVRLLAARGRIWNIVVNLLIALLMAVLVWQLPAAIASQVGVVPMVGFERYYLAVPLFVSALLILVNAVVEILLDHGAPGHPGPGAEA